MSIYFTLLIFPFLPAPLSNDRCWKRSFASASAVQASSPRRDRDSDVEGQHPTELDPQQLAQSHQPSLGVGRERGERKGAPGSWDGGLRCKEG